MGLPAAEGLSYISSLSLAYQDLSKNCTAYTYVNNNACNFCHEEVFSGERNFNSSNPIDIDRDRFVKVVWYLLKEVQQSDDDERGKRDKLGRVLNESRSIEEIVKILRKAAKVKN